MDRKEAIEHILVLESSVANEYYVSAREREEGLAETEAALRALGVTNEELG